LNAYIDSSVLLRVVLGEPDSLASWGQIDQAVSSELIRLECLQTIDRARVQLQLGDPDVSRQRADVLEAIDSLGVIALNRFVLERAAEPFPTLLGSLDAIHLASALLVRERYDSLIFATHDQQLAVAARAMGFSVTGALV
jgi:predicted nucleic acid-binding protein